MKKLVVPVFILCLSGCAAAPLLTIAPLAYNSAKDRTKDNKTSPLDKKSIEERMAEIKKRAADMAAKQKSSPVSENPLKKIAEIQDMQKKILEQQLEIQKMQKDALRKNMEEKEQIAPASVSKGEQTVK